MPKKSARDVILDQLASIKDHYSEEEFLKLQQLMLANVPEKAEQGFSFKGLFQIASKYESRDVRQRILIMYLVLKKLLKDVEINPEFEKEIFDYSIEETDYLKILSHFPSWGQKNVGNKLQMAWDNFMGISAPELEKTLALDELPDELPDELSEKGSEEEEISEDEFFVEEETEDIPITPKKGKREKMVA